MHIAVVIETLTHRSNYPIGSIHSMDLSLLNWACACGNIGNIYMSSKEPVKAVHYYTETLHLSTDKSIKATGYHNRGCARFDVAECKASCLLYLPV